MLETKLLGGSWIPDLDEHLSASEKYALSISEMDTQIRSEITLELVLGVDRARELLAKCKQLAEINLKGCRRCVFIGPHGRCTSYSKQPICGKHINKAEKMYPGLIQNVALRKAYERHLGSKKQFQMGAEVALMRTMLEVLMQKIGSQSNIHPEQIASIIVTCEKICGVIEKSSKLSVLTPEHVDEMLAKAVEIIADYVPAEKLEEVANKIQGITGEFSKEVAIPYEPGDSIPLAEPTVVTVQQRALLDLEGTL